MTGEILGAAEWIFECVLLAVMIATIIYAKRLDRLLRQIRDDRAALQTLLEQIGVSVAAAVAATDRLKIQSGETSARIASACAAADRTSEMLEQLIDRAVQVGKPQSRERSRSPSASCTTEQSAAGLKSRTERDLARMLADVSLS